jgi:hypothetical protein
MPYVSAGKDGTLQTCRNTLTSTRAQVEVGRYSYGFCGGITQNTIRRECYLGGGR